MPAPLSPLQEARQGTAENANLGDNLEFVRMLAPFQYMEHRRAWYVLGCWVCWTWVCTDIGWNQPEEAA